MTSQPGEYVIRNARLIDPSDGIDDAGWLHVRDGLIAARGVSGDPLPNVASRIDATDLIVCPGLIDIHVHLREPGGEHKETIETGCQAAVAGGFTTVCCMPNTSPAIDNVETLQYVQRRAAEVDLCRVRVIAAATKGRAGREVVDFAALVNAGAVAFSDDGDGIEDDTVCRAVCEGIKRAGSVLFPHCEFKDISKRGVMHLGHVSRYMDLPGYDPRGEEAMIERDIGIVEQTGVRYHVAHISTARGIALVANAARNGLPVTTEVCPHHLLLCDEDVVDANRIPNPNAKMSPPLRSANDVAACVDGVRTGKIACIVTDHAPHTADEKNAGFLQAPMGIIGLETSLGCAALALIKPGYLDWPELIERMSTAPARVLSLPGGTLQPGQPADITLIDPELEWTVDPSAFRSKCRNTPFAGWRLRGKAVATFVSGRRVVTDESVADRFAG